MLTRVKLRDEIKKYEKFIEKNPDSPLIVRLALIYLESGDIERAISLCNRAIQKYPDYSTAHLLMARCYMEIKAYSKALAELNRVVEILPDSKFVVDLISKISLKQRREETFKKLEKSEAIEKREDGEVGLPEFEIPEIASLGKESFAVDEKLRSDIVEEIFEMPEVGTDEREMREAKTVETQASYLDELIKRIEEGKGKQNVKSETVKEPSINFSEEDLTYEDMSIVTPALAEILTKQGAYEEAIKVYRKLIEQRPSEKEKYEREIKKIEERLGK
ncbi:Tetratricopeptide repeat-containing protein [Candidatus Kryptobacter tengchongensis]|nr:Tetratricopeptide repeat-containing protein [Candidatus Kryptobacter tengchongensis]